MYNVNVTSDSGFILQQTREIGRGGRGRRSGKEKVTGEESSEGDKKKGEKNNKWSVHRGHRSFLIKRNGKGGVEEKTPEGHAFNELGVCVGTLLYEERNTKNWCMRIKSEGKTLDDHQRCQRERGGGKK